ncbi:peroxisomal nicotinamide adenine dinucleotide carrier [Tanacetum coccineum]
MDAILKMIRYEGLHGFYKGMSKIVHSVLAAAILLMVKDVIVNHVRVTDPAVDHLAIQGNASDPAVDHLLIFSMFLVYILF